MITDPTAIDLITADDLDGFKAYLAEEDTLYFPEPETFATEKEALAFCVGIGYGSDGFRKDKGGEKLAESEEDLLEYRTDGTDAFETLYIGAEKFPYRKSYAFRTTGIL